MSNRPKPADSHQWIKLFFFSLLHSPRVLAFTNEKGCSKETKKWWYLCLFCQAYFAGGVLPTDMRVLWKLADAQTEWFFREHCAEVLACFSGTPDGTRLHHERTDRLLKSTSKTDGGYTLPSPLREEVEVGVGSDGESLFALFHAAHPRSTGGCAEENAFMEACKQDEAEALRITLMAKIYRQAFESGLMGHQPARAVNWLRDRIYNENPDFWMKGAPSDARGTRNRQAIQQAISELANGKD